MPDWARKAYPELDGVLKENPSGQPLQTTGAGNPFVSAGGSCWPSAQAGRAFTSAPPAAPGPQYGAQQAASSNPFITAAAAPQYGAQQADAPRNPFCAASASTSTRASAGEVRIEMAAEPSRKKEASTKGKKAKETNRVADASNPPPASKQASKKEASKKGSKAKQENKPDRCFGIDPWRGPPACWPAWPTRGPRIHASCGACLIPVTCLMPAPPPTRSLHFQTRARTGCAGCVVISIACTVLGSILLNQGNISGFGVVFSFDGIFSIMAMAFLFGPRKYELEPPRRATDAPRLDYA